MIAKDKQYHLAAGALICLVVGIIFAIPQGLAAAIVIGALKETVYDAGINAWLARKNLPPAHTVDFYDFLATAGGGLAAALVMFVVERGLS